jgi:hypothetical protein
MKTSRDTPLLGLAFLDCAGLCQFSCAAGELKGATNGIKTETADI